MKPKDIRIIRDRLLNPGLAEHLLCARHWVRCLDTLSRWPRTAVLQAGVVIIIAPVEQKGKPWLREMIRLASRQGQDVSV